MPSAESALREAFLAADHVSVASLLDAHPELCTHLDAHVFGCNAPPLALAKSTQLVDVLLDHGANVDRVSQWWKSGIGAEQVDPAVARHLADRGAPLSIHAAVAIGLLDVVRSMLASEPGLVQAKGGDGCQPLHFSRDAAIAELLLAAGADVNARDDDHASTPAQWRIGDAPDTVQFLLRHGAAPDIFLAAALGDLGLAENLVEENPACTAYRIGNDQGPFPGIGFQGRGGTIYQWSLGFNLSPHEVAHRRGHTSLYDFLMAHSTPRTQLLVAATMANRPLTMATLASDPHLLDQFDEEDFALLAKYCWETNKDIEAARLMLDLGFPVESREHNHGCTPLHNAAWCGDLELVRLLLDRGHSVNIVDPTYQATPLGWAVHSCVEAKRHPEGQFGKVAALLLARGASFDPQDYPVGNAQIDAVLREHFDAKPKSR